MNRIVLVILRDNEARIASKSRINSAQAELMCTGVLFHLAAGSATPQVGLCTPSIHQKCWQHAHSVLSIPYSDIESVPYALALVHFLRLMLRTFHVATVISPPKPAAGHSVH